MPPPTTKTNKNRLSAKAAPAKQPAKLSKRAAAVPAAPVPPKPPRRRSISKEKILAIATRMFAEYGFAAISIRDIASACKISIPSIYHFFGDKEKLYSCCCEGIFQDVSKQLHASLEQATSGHLRIKQFTATLGDVLMHNHNFRRLLQRELLRDERRNIDDLTAHAFKAEFEILTREIAALDGKKDAIDRTFSIYALTFGLLQLRRIGELSGIGRSISGSSEALAEYVLSIVLPRHSWHR